MIINTGTNRQYTQRLAALIRENENYNRVFDICEIVQAPNKEDPQYALSLRTTNGFKSFEDLKIVSQMKETALMLCESMGLKHPSDPDYDPETASDGPFCLDDIDTDITAGDIEIS